MARRRKTASHLLGRDTYHVVGPAGDLAVKGPAGPQAPGALALVNAQRIASTSTAPDTASLIVERRSVIGPPARLYRIDRDEHGTVRTTILDHQD